MRGNKIKVRAKRTLWYCDSIFKEGDTLYVQSILYDKPHLLHNGMACYYREGKEDESKLGPMCSGLKNKAIDEVVDLGNGQKAFKSCDAHFAPVGSYKDSILITEDGREYCCDFLRMPFKDIFEKI